MFKWIVVCKVTNMKIHIKADVIHNTVYNIKFHIILINKES